MRHRMGVKLFAIAVLVFILFAVFGYGVMSLWNWLMPVIFKLPVLTYWQAIGLLALSWVFFGSWRGFHGHGRWRRGMHARWEQMTPEQREEFRKAMESRWHGRCGSRSADSQPADSPGSPK
jgi:hypothetical protein